MQATFVDEPRRVVEQADGLVAEVMQRITETMAQERKGLEGQWAAGDSVSTEDLRVALQHYRSFSSAYSPHSAQAASCHGPRALEECRAILADAVGQANANAHDAGARHGERAETVHSSAKLGGVGGE